MKKKQTGVNPYPGIPLRKMLIFMKLLWVLLFGVCMSVQADVYSQQAKVTLDVKNVSLNEILKELGKQTKIDFLYNYNLTGSKGTFSLKYENKELVQVLDELLPGLGLEYTYDNSVVVIREKSATPQQKDYVITGKVLDNKNQPLPGVTIVLANTTLGVVSKIDGTFQIRLPMQKGNLTFSSIGFKTKQVSFEEGKELVVMMEEDVTDLDEVVVRAYGTQNKRETISALSTVKADEIKELPTASVENLLQGRLAGVNVINQSGAPGSAVNITIRGFNSLMVSSAADDGQPLYVIDGVPMHSFVAPQTGVNTMADIDPALIESITVLKDAAASSIYGSRAANGVILITTKKGQAGRSVFSANVSYSLSQLMEYPYQTGGRMERWMEILYKRNRQSAYLDWMTYTSMMPGSYEEVYGTSGTYDGFWGNGTGNVALDKKLQDSLNPFYNNSTNWWKYAFRTGKVLNANIQASGGSEQFQYMLGAGYYSEKGIMLNSNYARVNITSNLTAYPVERLRIDSRFYLAYVDKSASNSLSGSNGNYEGLTVRPTLQSTLEVGSGAVYDYWMRMTEGMQNKSDNYRAMVTLLLEYKFLKGLTFSASGNLDYSQSNFNEFTPSTLDSKYYENKSTGEVSRALTISTEELLKYRHTFKEDHNLDVLLGFNANKTQRFGIGGEGRHGASDYVYYYDNEKNPAEYNYGTDANKNIKSTTTYYSSFKERVMVSLFARLSYNYKQRYLFEATYRRDGSSTFGEDNRWANFPSFAVGWTFSQEPFMQWANWLDWGKIRASYGTSGKIFTDEYLAHGLIGQTGNTFNGNGGTGAARAISPDLTWEKSKQYDIGLDMDMFNYRVNFKLDYYYKYTSSLLYDVALPGTIFAESTRTENAMELSNEGLEFELDVNLFRESAVKWRTKFNISRNWNRFEKSYDGKDKGAMIIGLPLYQLKVYDDDGFYQSEDEVPIYYATNGQPKYLSGYAIGNGVSGLVGTIRLKDLDNDNYINAQNDQYYAVSPVTLCHGGWVHELRWKDFDLNILFNYGIGRKIINTNISTISSTGPILVDVRDYTFWTKEGDEADLPRIGKTIETRLRSNIENVHNISLKQLTLGYNVPRSVAQKFYLSGVRGFVTVENLFYLSNYSNGNPEVVNVYTGLDTGLAYPLPRKWTLGLTLNF